MGQKPQEKNCAAPGHVIRVDPRMLSTAQTVSSCGPGFGLKEPVEALAFLVSDKEGRAIVGRQWALRAAKGGALQDTSSTRPGKLSPLETGLNPTALGGQRRLIPACSHPTQPASAFTEKMRCLPACLTCPPPPSTWSRIMRSKTREPGWGWQVVTMVIYSFVHSHPRPLLSSTKI